MQQLIMTWKHKKKEDFLVSSMATNVVVILKAWALQMLVIVAAFVSNKCWLNCNGIPTQKCFGLFHLQKQP